MISNAEPAQRDMVLPTRLIARESCGCRRSGHPGLAPGLKGTAMRVIARRLLFYIVTAIAAVTVDFFIPRLMPGNPVEAVLAHLQGNVTPGTIRALELQYGSDSPQGLWGQYTTFWAHLLQGNLGISTSYYPSTVTSVIRGALPWTVALVGVSTVISFALGTLLDILVAWRRGTWLDNLLPAHHVLPGRAVLLRCIPGPGHLRRPAGLVPHRTGLRSAGLPRGGTPPTSAMCSTMRSCPRSPSCCAARRAGSSACAT